VTKTTSHQILDGLRVRFGGTSTRSFAAQRIFLTEFRLGTGYGRNNEQRLDAWSIELTDKLVRRAFEVKVSRSDFLREIKDARKRHRALLVSNEFWFAAPPGLISVNELPPEAGLIEVEHFPDGGPPAVRIIEPAPWRDTPPPTWRFVASILRRAEAAPHSPTEGAQS